MPVCSIVKTITPRCRGRPDALLHEAECNSASDGPRYREGGLSHMIVIICISMYTAQQSLARVNKKIFFLFKQMV